MDIQVEFTSQLRASLGVSEERITLDAGATISQLLGCLAEKYRTPFQQLVFDQRGMLLPSILLCVNGQQVASDFDRTLCHGDTVTLLSAISGG